MMVNLNIEVNIIPAFQVQTNEQKEKVRAVRDERKKFKEIPEDLRKKHREHKENFERAREPLLQGLASKSDLKLFKEAQAKACEVLVRANSMTFYYYGVIFNFSHFCHQLTAFIGNFFQGFFFFCSINNYTCIKPEKVCYIYYNIYMYIGTWWGYVL